MAYFGKEGGLFRPASLPRNALHMNYSNQFSKRALFFISSQGRREEYVTCTNGSMTDMYLYRSHLNTEFNSLHAHAHICAIHTHMPHTRTHTHTYTCLQSHAHMHMHTYTLTHTHSQTHITYLFQSHTENCSVLSQSPLHSFCASISNAGHLVSNKQ